MRIAMVCPYSLTLPGGVQTQVMGLARSLRAIGHDVRVLAPCDGPPPDTGVTPLGNSIPAAGNGSVAPIAPDLPCALRTIRALRDEQFDVLHLHEPLVPGPTLTTLLFADSPMVATFHRAGWSSAYTALRPGVRFAVRRLALRVAVSDDARSTATQALGGRYEVLWNGIEVDRFAKATPSPHPGLPTILFIGRHEERKGLAVLLEAMRLLGPDVVCWVASDGPQTPELMRRTEGDERIVWLGRLADDDKASRLAAADVFCAPSLYGESFGVVLLEAMAAQIPIVASDLPGYRNVVDHDREALLVPPGDVDGLARALGAVLASAPLARRLAAAGEARATAFAMDALAERYTELYERVAGAGP